MNSKEPLETPLVIVSTAHRGAVSKTTMVQHLAELGDELGYKTLSFVVDDQLDIGERLTGTSLDPELGDGAWSWGEHGTVWASRLDELSSWDLSDFDLVFVDMPPKLFLPKMQVDRVVLPYNNYEAVKNNERIYQECLSRNIPCLRIAWGDASVHRWAKQQHVEIVPSIDEMRLSGELARPIWQYMPTDPRALAYKGKCNAWMEWIKDPAGKAQASARQVLRKPAARRVKAGFASR